MIENANSALAKDPDNSGILLLVADDYSEKGEQLDKAEAYAKKAASLCDTAKKPEGASDADWQKQIAIRFFAAATRWNYPEKNLNFSNIFLCHSGQTLSRDRLWTRSGDTRTIRRRAPWTPISCAFVKS